MKFTVEMSKWHRGKGSCYSRLRRSSDGKMCCLGFREVAVGHSINKITDVGIPSELYRVENIDIKPEDEALINRKLFLYNHYEASSTCEAIVAANDDTTITDEERIKKLTELFASIGDEVTFVP